MPTKLPDQHEILVAIRKAAEALKRSPSRSEFMRSSGMTEYHVLKHYPSWREAVRAAGLEPYSTNAPLNPDVLLEDWGKLVRGIRHIPTREQYRRDGTFSVGVFAKYFGPWSQVPSMFRSYADDKPEWADVVALLPLENARMQVTWDAPRVSDLPNFHQSHSPENRHAKLEGRPTYGNPIDFRGLRHEPVNEQGVVFLFGMVARELGYYVEAVQTGFPDCEAKRQVNAGKWQRVRIEFEFESRNFRDHGHSLNGCDIIVCWRHNWHECPPHLEVVQLCSVIQTLSSSEE